MFKAGCVCVPLLLLLAASSCCGKAAYLLDWEAKGSSFFDQFEFATFDDPTNGFVNYINQSDAEAAGIISVDANGQVKLATDTTNVVANSSRGRDSVRLQSIQSFTGGLFIADLDHMPTGCGTWPAWWLCGPDWPLYGEIDIIEGVNRVTEDETSLHTSVGCNMSSVDPSLMSGTYLNTDCETPPDNGCSVNSANGSYGAPFNTAGGGVYALEWTDTHIASWYFGRSSIPSDITSGSPDPSGWGKPYAYFGLGSNCSPGHFQNHTVIINLTFCGDYAGGVWGSDSVCSALGTCVDYVRNNPSEFTEAYWLFNYVQVYQLSDLSAASNLQPLLTAALSSEFIIM